MSLTQNLFVGSRKNSMRHARRDLFNLGSHSTIKKNQVNTLRYTVYTERGKIIPLFTWIDLSVGLSMPSSGGGSTNEKDCLLPNLHHTFLFY